MSSNQENVNKFGNTEGPSVQCEEERRRNQSETGTSSSNRFNSPQRASYPPKRITLPNCSKCKQTLTEPHTVYCCGSMYCHTCLVEKMITSVERGAQVTCDSCGKAMREAPGQSKNLRGDAAAAVSSSSFDPPAAKRSRQNLPYGGNLTADSQFSQNVMQNRLTPMTVSSPANSTNQQYIGPKHYSSSMVPSFEFQQPNSLNEPFQNRVPNPLSNPPSLPSQTSSMGSMYTPTSMISQSMESLTSLPSNASYPGAMLGSFSSIPQNMRNAFIPNSLINIGSPLPMNQEEVPVGTTCTICWVGSKVPVQIKCCKKVFCRECLVISLKVKPRCPSCNQVFGNEDIFNLFEMKISVPVKPIPGLLPPLIHQLQRDHDKFCLILEEV